MRLEDGLPSDPCASSEPLEGELPEGRMFGDDQIKDGGGAMTAYARSQFTEMGEEEVAVVRPALLRYCELDTLAVVMLWEEWVHATG